MDPLAAYGAALSTLLAIAGSIKWWRERRTIELERTKIRFSAEPLITHNERDGMRFDVVQFTVSNLGRETVILDRIEASLKNGSATPGVFREPAAYYGIRDRCLPYALKEGETVELPLFYMMLFSQDVKSVVLFDSDDNRHVLSDDNIAELKTKAEEISTERGVQPNPEAEQGGDLKPDHAPR